MGKAGGPQSPTRRPNCHREPEAGKLSSHHWNSKGEQSAVIWVLCSCRLGSSFTLQGRYLLFLLFGHDDLISSSRSRLLEAGSTEAEVRGDGL